MRPGWQERYAARTMEPAAALECVRRGTRIFVGSGCAEPVRLVTEMARREDVADVEVLHLMTVGGAPYAGASQAGRFRHNAFFIGTNVREAVEQGIADYTPVFLSDIPALFSSRRLRLDVALVSVTPPDRHGFCSLGVSVDVVPSALAAARTVVAEVNPHMPRTHGATFVHADAIDAFVASEAPILELPPPPPDEASARIAEICRSLVPDGATLQLGIGSIPDAVSTALAGKRDLGLHTEMFSDGVMRLIEAGALTCRRKSYHPYRAVASFCMGSQRLYEFVDDNPFFEFLPTEVVNDPVLIARNDRMISINSALQVDLTGQVCADSIGPRFYSGIGGQVDFIRGAARSAGGRSIIALPSTARNGTISRLVPTLTEGAGVVTTRGDVDTVVTEYGVAELKGRTVRERALALASIAHPEHRTELLHAARARHLVTAAQIEWPRAGRPYPVELESHERFGDLELAFRPVRPADERLLREFFYSHSPETIYLRYQRAVRSLSPEQIQHLCTLDYDERMAIAGFASEGPGGGERMVAIARYDVDRQTGFAEAALVVHDQLQGRGIGTYLFARLVEIARERGVRGFVASVLAGNRRMLGVFHKSGLAVESKLEAGCYTVRMPFPERRDERPAGSPAAR